MNLYKQYTSDCLLASVLWQPVSTTAVAEGDCLFIFMASVSKYLDFPKSIKFGSVLDLKKFKHPMVTLKLAEMKNCQKKGLLKKQTNTVNEAAYKDQTMGQLKNMEEKWTNSDEDFSAVPHKQVIVQKVQMIFKSKSENTMTYPKGNFYCGKANAFSGNNFMEVTMFKEILDPLFGISFEEYGQLSNEEKREKCSSIENTDFKVFLSCKENKQEKALDWTVRKLVNKADKEEAKENDI